MNRGINKNIKRLSSIAAALMFAVSVIGCKHNVNNKPETFNVTFSVDGVGGTLKATVGGSEINSGNKVEHGKTVTFTATPTAGFKVKGWTLDGVAVNGANASYALKVSKAANVKVSFEKLPPGKASYTVKHYREKAEGGYPAEPTETENLSGTVGTNAAYTPKTGGAYEGFTCNSSLTKVNGAVQPTGTIAAGNSTVVELFYGRNTIQVTFKLAGGNVSGDAGPVVKTGKYGTALTAPAPVQTGFVFKGWSPEPPTPFLFPKANAEYTAQWAPVYAITFGVDGGVGGTLKATVEDGSEITSGKTIEHGKTVAFTATPDAGYRVKGWTLDGTAIAEAGTNTEYTLTITQAVNVTVSFEPKKALLTLEAGKNTVKVKAKTADGKPITVEGCTVNELANEAETTLTAKEAGTQIVLIGELIELDCRGEKTPGGNRPLIALDVSGLTALQKLNCQYNKITELDVQGLTALQELICNGNTLTALDVHGLTKLQKLDCKVNQLTALNVSDCTALQELICNNNELSTLDVSGLTKLQKLNCSKNQLTVLDVSGLTALQELNCQINQIPELNVQGLTKLQELSCSDNQLSTLDVSGLTALQKLYCRSNQIPELNVQGLTSLRELICYTNQLTTLNVQGCTALKSLLCYKNKLNADVFTKLFNDLPIREASDGAKAILYVEDEGVTEGNCKNFSTPESLKKAFDNAKDVKHWKMQKTDEFGFLEDI